MIKLMSTKRRGYFTIDGRRAMVAVPWSRVWVLSVGCVALACNDPGTPPGPPAQVVRSGPDHQDWYFNNPLPQPYSVTVLDANDRPVRGVPVDWSMTTGGGTLDLNPSTTNAIGVASTIHTLGSATTYVVMATVVGFPSVAFSASAKAPPTATTADVAVADNSFTPDTVGIKSGGTVTWNWTGALTHNVTLTSGPTPLPPNVGDRASGAGQTTFTVVGRYSYRCTHHAGMTGEVHIVN
jgi:plastocyanin